jgi:hypothetical protein
MLTGFFHSSIGNPHAGLDSVALRRGIDVLGSSMQEHGEQFENAWSLITSDSTV